MSKKFKLKILLGFCAVIFLFYLWEVYIPYSLNPKLTKVYTVQRGLGYKNIALDLENQGIIKNKWFFVLYAVVSNQHTKLQAGSYELSSSMSVFTIVKKFVLGDVIKNNLTIIEGWSLEDIGQYLENKKLYSKKDFLELAKKDWSQNFEFLKDKPKELSLEGYIFPDTYEIYFSERLEEFLKSVLVNFDKKMTANLMSEISSQKKSVFQIITMASIIEKEVRTSEDKKIVSGILWKRMENGVPLQVDATINYITDKNDASVAIKDTKIDSPYNTYKYQGLPLGPISNPGMESILAAIYPIKSGYWYYLSANGSGKTIFSKTLDEHNKAVAEYLK